AGTAATAATAEASANRRVMTSPSCGRIPRERRLGAPAREQSLKRMAVPECSSGRARSNPFRQADRGAAAQPDRSREQRIGGRAFGAGGERQIAMRALVGAETIDHPGQFRIVVGRALGLPEPLELAAIVA